MQKTLNELAEYLRILLPPEISKTFAIDAMFSDISNEESIRKGVIAFRDFLSRLYNRLPAEDGSFGKPKKEANAFTDNTNITASYPFLGCVIVVLANIGLQGSLSESRDAILLDSAQSLLAKNNMFHAKIPDSMKIDSLRFLTVCGIRVDGLDLNEKKLDLSAYRPLLVSYPENPAMLTGLIVMATAQRNLNSRVVQDIFLRCDYRVLANQEIEPYSALKDLINPLPADVREFVTKLHQNYVGQGHKCVFSATNLYIRFTYYCKSKELWRLNLSLNNGYTITIKATNTEKYADTIKNFPEWLQEKVARGYGCGKKKGTSPSCDEGCRGFRVSLDKSFMEICNDIETWIDKEVSCLQKK